MSEPKHLRRGALAVLAGVAAVAVTGITAPSQAVTYSASTDLSRQASTTYDNVELQARSNLLINDEGFNLPPGSSFNSITPDINDNAEVAFRVQAVPEPGDLTTLHPGVWLGGGGTGEIVYTGDAALMVDNDVTLNNDGDVAFTLGAGFSNGLYMYKRADGSAHSVGTAPVLPNSYRNPRITDSGDIAFQANYSGARSYAAVIDGTGVTYASDSRMDPESPYTYLYSLTANNSAQIAAKVATSADLTSELEIRIFEPDGSSRLVLANTAVDPTSPYSDFRNSVALSDDGTVAVIATRASDGRQVVVRSDGRTTTEIAAVDPDGPIKDLGYFPPDLNDSGQVVFRAADADGQAIYVGDGTSLTRVIGNGDEVETDLGTAELGQHDDSPVFGGAPRINVHGDIVFTAGVHPAGDRTVEWGTGVFVAYASEQEGPDSGLWGVASDANDGNPVAGTTVTIVDSDGTVVGEAITGADGRYQIATGPGTYVVTGVAENYSTTTVEATVDADGITRVDLALPTAAVQVKPSSLELTGAPGEVHHATVVVGNVGSALMNWKLQSTADWLMTKTRPHDLAPGQQQVVTVVADGHGVRPGDQTDAFLVVRSNAGRHPTVRIRVTLTVQSRQCMGWKLGTC